VAHERSVSLAKSELLDFCGKNDEKIRQLEKTLGTKLILRGTDIKIVGEQPKVEHAVQVIGELLQAQRQSGKLSPQQFRQGLARARRFDEDARDTAAGRPVDDPPTESLGDLFGSGIPVPLRNRQLTPLTAGQKKYIQAMSDHDITFGIGPAGTGKTYLAMAMAVNYLLRGQVRRIILCRPAVEAGEKLGFLPGDLAQKFDPYVRPLWDALYEMVETEKIREYLEQGVIEIAPLAFMRGRTLNNAFVILDEGQNTTTEQMKMFLTRLGFESKGVVTGDVTQIDLPQSQRSGLLHVQKVLKDIEGISFVNFSKKDVVRHDVVMRIVRAYEAWEANEADEVPGRL
jgi:phosphate starvation-inducible PhoH-like protein